jgi:ribosomal protein L20A (L18A)
VNEVRERNSNVIKNFGIQIKYNSRSGTHNMCVRRASVPRGRARARGRTRARARAHPSACSPILRELRFPRSHALTPLAAAAFGAPSPRLACRYKQYRDVSLCGAVEQMYAELAGRHRARFASIQIVSTHLVPAGIKASLDYNPEVDGDVLPPAVSRASMKEFLDSQVKFPLAHRIPRASSKTLRSTFVARRPTTFVG